MKLSTALFLNVVTVVTALVIYDSTRSDPAPTDRATTVRPDTAALEQRIAELEVQVKAMPRETRTVVEKQTEVVEKPAETSTPEKKLDVQRFRKLQSEARREEAIEKNRKRIDRALKKVPFQLSDAQRKRVHEARVDFEPTLREMWGEAKSEAAEQANGAEIDWKPIIERTNERIRLAFAETIEDSFRHRADAEAVAAAVMAWEK